MVQIWESSTGVQQPFILQIEDFRLNMPSGAGDRYRCLEPYRPQYSAFRLHDYWPWLCEALPRYKSLREYYLTDVESLRMFTSIASVRTSVLLSNNSKCSHRVGRQADSSRHRLTDLRSPRTSICCYPWLTLTGTPKVLSTSLLWDNAARIVPACDW